MTTDPKEPDSPPPLVVGEPKDPVLAALEELFPDRSLTDPHATPEHIPALTDADLARAGSRGAGDGSTPAADGD